ncbi:MAG: exodeoxyribonuclease VII large subunit [Planctomycetota bacterium]
MSAGPLPERPLTVAELTARVKALLEESFGSVWVVGEIGDLTRARSGHLYLRLKDESAELSAVIWRSTAARLPFDPAEGMEVLARGRLVVYGPRGVYQLDIRALEPRGVGALQLAFEKLKERLLAEGLLDPERKRPIPFLPRRIGVVTSPTGAAIRDILKVIRRRSPRVSVLLHPARVQGEGAAEEVARGIRVLSERGGLDVLIVGRGGGSLEDLWAFNEEPVARAIAASSVPVISAVGHEIDVTIADLVADVRAATPSAAAEIAVPEEAELLAHLRGLGERLDAAVRAGVSLCRERLAALAGAYGLRRFPDRLRESAQLLDERARRLARGSEAAVARGRARIAELASRMEALSPVAVLGRGYSVTTLEAGESPLTDATHAEPGALIRTRLARGRLLSRVERVEEGIDG